MEQNNYLGKAKGLVLSSPDSYCHLVGYLVGRLIYLTITRPDFSSSVHTLAQFMHQPRQAHWDAALGVLCYLKRSLGQGLLLPINTDLELQAYCDSDWASYPVTHCSLIFYLLRILTQILEV